MKNTITHNQAETDTRVAELYPQSRLPGMMFSDYVKIYLTSIYPHKPRPFFEKVVVWQRGKEYQVGIVETDAEYADGGKTIVTFGDGYVQRYDASTGRQLSNSAPWQVQNARV